jgi:hypothetical protein
MASLSVEDLVLTKQRTEISLRNANPFAQAAFRAFITWMAGHKPGVQLQKIDFANLTADTNPLDGAIQIYAVYAKKQATGTDAFYNAFNDATDDSTAADAAFSLGLFESGDEVVLFYPNGLPFSAGLVHGSYTTLAGFNGTTPSTSGDGPDGFLLVGA